MERNKLSPHVFYIIGILVAIIIMLVSVKWVKVDDLVKIITFALTLTSLVLALLAIIYAIFTNSKSIEHITTLTDTNKSVSQTSEHISEITRELSAKIDSIPSAIDTVKAETFKNRKIMQELIDTSEERSSRVRPSNDDNSEVEEEINKEIVEDIVHYSAFTGQLALYACSLSNSNTIMFSLSDVFGSKAKYVMGYIIAIRSIGFIDFIIKSGIVTVTYVDELISKSIKNAIVKYATEHDKKNDLLDSDNDSWRNKANMLKAYFEES
jgi:hypothetical protein